MWRLTTRAAHVPQRSSSLRSWRLVAGLFRAAAPRPKSVEEEAQAVREMALQYQKVDPRFAADLMAAADRHERING